MEKRIRVIHLLSNLSLRSGVASVVVNYCRWIDQTKVKFSFLYFDDVKTETYIEELKAIGAEIIFIPRNKIIKRWKSFCAENYGKYDILHNHQTFLAPLLINVKKQLGIKKLLTHAHATRFSDTRMKGVRNFLLSYPSKYISDSLVACSYEAGKALFGRVFLSKGTVIHNAINTRVFSYNEGVRNQVREQLGFSDSFVVGHVGNMTPQKNHGFLLDVFKEVLSIRADAKLLLVGDGYLRGEIEGKIKRLGMEQSVLLMGVQSDVFRFFNAMDVFLFPSLFEGLGIVLVEAQACGLKCVYSDEVPIEADCNREQNVRLSLKDSPQKWAEYICSVQNRVDNSKAICQNGYEISCAAEELIKYYCSLLSGGNYEA